MTPVILKTLSAGQDDQDGLSGTIFELVALLLGQVKVKGKEIPRAIVLTLNRT